LSRLYQQLTARHDTSAQSSAEFSGSYNDSRMLQKCRQSLSDCDNVLAEFAKEFLVYGV